MSHDPKPVSKARREAALEIATRDERLKPLLSGRNRPIFVEPNLHDPRRPETDEHLLVGLYDYETSRSVVALVNMSSGAVEALHETGAQFQLSEEEQRDAETLAGKDARVRKFLGSRKPNPLTRLYFPPNAADASHRYAIVFLRPTPSERRYAVVDLSAGRVADVLTALVN